MPELDVWPVTVRGPLVTNRSKLITFARAFTRDGRLYIAESRNKGRTVTAVTWYPAPEEEMQRRGNRNAKWGPWSWSSCGCASQWRSQSLDVLISMAVPAYPESEPTHGDS